MEPQATSMDRFYRVYLCGHCHAELRQMLVRDPKPYENHQPRPRSWGDCAQCAEAELHCFSCDDPICNQHIRTFEKYANVFSPELANTLIQRYGNRIYCPLCFKAIFNRFSVEMQRPSPQRVRFFNLPLILGITALVLIIVLGVQRCNQTSELFPAEEHVLDDLE